MPRSKSSARPAPVSVRREPAKAPLTTSVASRDFELSPARGGEGAMGQPRSTPRFRTPTHCTMSSLYYEGWRGEQRVGYQVPKLRLSGRWLEACGFAVGDDLQVTVGRGMLLVSRRRAPGKD